MSEWYVSKETQAWLQRAKDARDSIDANHFNTQSHQQQTITKLRLTHANPPTDNNLTKMVKGPENPAKYLVQNTIIIILSSQ